MKKNILFIGLVALSVASCAALGNKLKYLNKAAHIKKVTKAVFFNPDVFPDIPEIHRPTDMAFSSAASNFAKENTRIQVVNINTTMSFDSIDVNYIKEICQNNDAQVVLVPKVKYFKVGIGKYVFSNQVVVSVKLYNANGDFVIETSCDTYKGNARLLGTAENSVKIGTEGALRKMLKEIKHHKLNTPY